MKKISSAINFINLNLPLSPHVPATCRRVNRNALNILELPLTFTLQEYKKTRRGNGVIHLLLSLVIEEFSLKQGNVNQGPQHSISQNVKTYIPQYMCTPQPPTPPLRKEKVYTFNHKTSGFLLHREPLGSGIKNQEFKKKQKRKKEHPSQNGDSK